ncbi:glycoside hydrolase family 9 protein [Kribbella ginsengisoli]|uniref:glycoside hydrolase family 9 protein n=1 Tax=Kribbella ginsengisoli TaxID=363865 RepID=UPI0031D744C1
MQAKDSQTPCVLVAHLGYGTSATKAVVAVLPDLPFSAELHGPDGISVLRPGPVEHVPGWTGGPYSRIPLPGVLAPGTYSVRVVAEGLDVRSEPFVVAPERLQRQTMSDVLAYFKAMRSSGEIDRKDRAAQFWDDPSGATVDARGGWLDASGDTSKFLSHLTYTSTMSPQQIPLCAWAMLAARDELAAHTPSLTPVLGARLRDEALWGADFLTRFRSPTGTFYTGIFDALTKRLEERFITAPLQNSVRTTRYQAAYRQGAGLAIAALARASTTNTDGDFPRSDYLAAARAAFTHLETHNRDYLFDHTESIIDDYAALLAATELARAEALPHPQPQAETVNPIRPDAGNDSSPLRPDAGNDSSPLRPEAGGGSGPVPGASRAAARRRASALIARYVRGAAAPGEGAGAHGAQNEGADGPPTVGLDAGVHGARDAGAGARGARDAGAGAHGAGAGAASGGPTVGLGAGGRGLRGGGPGWFRGDEGGRPFFHAAEPGLPILALLRFAEVLHDAPEAAPARATALRAMLDTLDRTASVANPFGYPRALTQPLGGVPRESFFFPHANETGYWWQGENAAIASLSAAASSCARLDGVSDEDRARLRRFADDQLAWITGRNPFDSSMVQGRGRNNADYSSDFPNLPGGIVNGVTSGWSDEDDVAFLPEDAPEGDSWRWAEQWIPHTGWFLLAVAAAG